MVKIYVYKKWNFLILLNRLVTVGFFVYKKKNIFLCDKLYIKSMAN